MVQAHPFRALRIAGGTWDAAEAKARSNGLGMSEVVTRLLDRWRAGPDDGVEYELLTWVRAQEGGAAWALRELRCPDCHHIQHVQRCWDFDCHCDRMGQE